MLLTKEEMVNLIDFLEGERRRLEDEDGADPVQDDHAAQAWWFLWNLYFS